MLTIVTEGKMYLKGSIVGFYGKKHGKFYSLEASLPGGIVLHGKEIRMTIEILEDSQNRVKCENNPGEKT